MASADRNLLPGERLDWTARADAVDDRTSDEAINDKYVRGEIRIVVEQARYPLKQVTDLVRSADYNLQPDFQRRPRWSRERQSRLIESFVVNVPVPPVFLYESELSRYEVMDGRQRLTAIAEFYEDKFSLQGLTQWPELNGRRYSQLPEQVRRGIDRRYLSSIILLHETAKSTAEADRLKQLVFERINSGGEDLSDQEKRNALHPGAMNTLCVRLSRLPSFCAMWGIPEPDRTEFRGGENWTPPAELGDNELYRTMGDVELVLRFFAHRQRGQLWKSGALDEYLTRYLSDANGFSRSTLRDLEETFMKTADLAYRVLGPDAFLLYRARKHGWLWVGRPTLVAYDPIMFAFSRLISVGDRLVEQAANICNALPEFYQNNSAAFDGRKVNLSDVRVRDQLFFKFLEGFTE
ncbi:DUF262 domain-containing protein [Amycolatopsis japonica]